MKNKEFLEEYKKLINHYLETLLNSLDKEFENISYYNIEVINTKELFDTRSDIGTTINDVMSRFSLKRYKENNDIPLIQSFCIYYAQNIEGVLLRIKAHDDHNIIVKETEVVINKKEISLFYLKNSIELFRIGLQDKLDYLKKLEEDKLIYMKPPGHVLPDVEYYTIQFTVNKKYIDYRRQLRSIVMDLCTNFNIPIHGAKEDNIKINRATFKFVSDVEDVDLEICSFDILDTFIEETHDTIIIKGEIGGQE